MSQKNPHDGEGRRSLRPWFLVASLVVTWLVGMQGMTGGCHTVAYLRGGSIPDASLSVEAARQAPNQAQAFKILSADAEARAIAETRERTFPLAVAAILLSGLLVLGSALGLAGRPGAPRLLGQALVANIALAVVDYALTSHTRALYLDELTSSARELAAATSTFIRPESFATKGRILLGMRLIVFDIGALVVAFGALFTKRSRAFFDVAARTAAERRVDDEDDV